jgi:hypothetical protein
LRRVEFNIFCTKKWGKYFIIAGEEPEAAELLAAHEVKNNDER